MMPLTRIPSGGRLRLGRERHQGGDQLVALQLLAPIGQERLGLAEDVGAVLLLVGLRGRDGVAGPLEPSAHAVIVDLLLVPDERSGRNALALEAGHERDVHLLAAVLQLEAEPDDGVERLPM
jgi:hypothetical protein